MKYRLKLLAQLICAVAIGWYVLTGTDYGTDLLERAQQQQNGGE